MSKLRKSLIAIVVAGAGIAVAVQTGTFASFTASTNNSATFDSGTLVLSNQKNSATACMSTGGGTTDTNSNSCDSAFALTVKKPGDASTVDITLTGAGSINASALKAFATAACNSTNSSGESYHGSGNICSSIDVYVQQFADATSRTNNDTTGGTCLYGGGTATACAYDNTKTLTAFGTAYPNAGQSLGLGALNSGASRYFRIGVQMDSSAGNTVQGLEASFGFTWQSVQ